MKVSGQIHAPAASPPWARTRYYLNRRLGVTQSQCLRVWRRETSLPGLEIQFLGHPACSLVTISSRLPLLLLVNLSRIQDYVWIWYFLLNKLLSDTKPFSILPVMSVEQQKVCRYAVTNTLTALVFPVVLLWESITSMVWLRDVTDCSTCDS
jgi:hypothetical protein